MSRSSGGIVAHEVLAAVSRSLRSGEHAKKKAAQTLGLLTSAAAAQRREPMDACRLGVRELLGQDLLGPVEDPRIVQGHDATIGSVLQVHAHGPAIAVAIATEIIPHRLHVQVQLPGDAMDAAIGKVVLDLPQLVEGDVHVGRDLVREALKVRPECPFSKR